MTRKLPELKVTQFRDYKEFIRRTLELSESLVKGQKTLFASEIGCQLSYLSRVLNGTTHLNLEQSEAACRYFFFNAAETSYFLALVGAERAGTDHLRTYWEQEQKRLLEENRQLHRRVSLEQPLDETQMAIYYSDWHYSALHVLASIHEFQTPEVMAETLHLPLSTVRAALGYLISANLLRNENGRIKATKTQVHLAKSSPLSKQHMVNWKLRSIDFFNRGKPDDLHYVSAVSLSKVDYLKIKELFLECIEATRSTVRSSEDETAAVYMMDLFELV